MQPLMQNEKEKKKEELNSKDEKMIGRKWVNSKVWKTGKKMRNWEFERRLNIEIYMFLETEIYKWQFHWRGNLVFLTTGVVGAQTTDQRGTRCLSSWACMD